MFVYKQLAGSLVGRQSVHLSSGSVERGHELGMESLSERFGGYGRLEIGEDLDVTPHKKTGVDQ